MESLFIGLIVGVVFAYFVFSRYASLKKIEKVNAQSVVLMENIRTVSKLITVEADFAEIYHYEADKHKWLNVLIGKKKALLLIDAKAHMGFDLTKINLDSDTKSKVIKITNFPQPELLSIETDFKYYDKKDGWLNPITSSDLTDINKEAKQHIVDKIPGSGVLEEASGKALETIKLMEKLAETINWKLDYSSLVLNNLSTNSKITKNANS
mgnify:CR=1 FL=1